jgi:hypothetical protein
MREIIKHKRKIAKLFKASSQENYDNGMTWYSDANDVARALSIKHNIGIQRVIGIMAALSPNNKWARNKIDTDKFLSKPSLDTKVCTFKNQRQKALDIYYGTGLVKDIEKTLNGIKTKNFFNNILWYQVSDKVTVDMWAFRSVGVEEKLKNVPLVTQAYKEVANDLNIQPHQLQAVVWGVVRGSLV